MKTIETAGQEGTMRLLLDAVVEEIGRVGSEIKLIRWPRRRRIGTAFRRGEER